MDKVKKNKKAINRQILLLCLFVIVLFVLETLLLENVTKVEGVKIGLYNIFIIYVIVNLKPRYAYLLAAVKILTGMIIGSSVLLYPLLGGLLSIIAMTAAKNIFSKRIGFLGIGIIGALTYNLCVYIIAAISLKSFTVFYNLPSVLLLSALYGSLTGGLSFLFAKSKIIRSDSTHNS